MKIRGILLVIMTVLLTLMVANYAWGHTIIHCETTCSRPYQRWIDESLMPTPDKEINIVEGTQEQLGHPCAGGEYEADACELWPGEIILNPATVNRGIFMHEVGHDFDDDYLLNWQHERFAQTIKIRLPWRYEEWDVHSGPSEYFAEIYSICAVRGLHTPQYTMTRPNDTWLQPRQIFQACTLSQRAYARVDGVPNYPVTYPE